MGPNPFFPNFAAPKWFLAFKWHIKVKHLNQEQHNGQPFRNQSRIANWESPTDFTIMLYMIKLIDLSLFPETLCIKIWG